MSYAKWLQEAAASRLPNFSGRLWLPYLLFLALLVLLNGFVFLTPYLASQGNPEAGSLYAAFSPTCHQLTSRSLCMFKSGTDGSLSIGDCLPSDKLLNTRQNTVKEEGGIGYKIPVCSRDVAIYLAMLVGLLALPFIQKIDSENWPSKWILLAAAVPIAIDGTTQLLGMRESDNTLRMITGAIIGVVLPFYILPMLNSLISFANEKISDNKKGKKK